MYIITLAVSINHINYYPITERLCLPEYVGVVDGYCDRVLKFRTVRTVRISDTVEMVRYNALIFSLFNKRTKPFNGCRDSKSWHGSTSSELPNRALRNGRSACCRHGLVQRPRFLYFSINGQSRFTALEIANPGTVVPVLS